MPFDMKNMPPMPSRGGPVADDPEESSEQDAISAALDSIRQAVDDAERELVLGKKGEADAEPGEGA